MSDILVSPDEIRSHASAIRAQAQEAQSSFTTMKSRLEALAGQFRGKSAVAFDQQFNEWHSSATGLIQALEGLGGWLSAVADTLQTVDEDLASKLTSS